MPWTAKSAPKKIKKASDRAKWASIANAIYKECMKKGDDKTCAPKAIRIANSKFSEEKGVMKTQKVPRGALRIVEVGGGCQAFTEFFGEGEDKKPKLKMVAYSGGIIKGHWYWDNLAIDLDGIKFGKGKFPILEDHMTSKKIAFSKDPILDGKIEINPDKTQFVDTEESAEFQKLSADGFPYQCSIYAKPTVVERVSEGASVKVNGFTLKGPGTVWRECQFKEASVCVFGWDSQTNATAFSKEEVEIDIEETEILAQEEPKIKLIKRKSRGGDTMDLNELKEKHPELVEEIQLEAKKESDIEIAKKETEFSKKEEGLKEENEKLTERTLDLEKKEAIRAENELKKSANNIWTKKLSESDIPETLFDKVRQYVSHVKFTEKGILDVEKFGEAVDAEIKDWEDRGVTSKVIGAGFTEKSVDETELAEKQESVDKDVNALRQKVGEKPLEKE